VASVLRSHRVLALANVKTTLTIEQSPGGFLCCKSRIYNHQCAAGSYSREKMKAASMRNDADSSTFIQTDSVRNAKVSVERGARVRI